MVAILIGHLLLHYTTHRFRMGLATSQMGEGRGEKISVRLILRVNSRHYINTRYDVRSAIGDQQFSERLPNYLFSCASDPGPPLIEWNKQVLGAVLVLAVVCQHKIASNLRALW